MGGPQGGPIWLRHSYRDPQRDRHSTLERESLMNHGGRPANGLVCTPSWEKGPEDRSMGWGHPGQITPGQGHRSREQAKEEEAADGRP